MRHGWCNVTTPDNFHFLTVPAFFAACHLASALPFTSLTPFPNLINPKLSRHDQFARDTAVLTTCASRGTSFLSIRHQLLRAHLATLSLLRIQIR